MLVTHQVLSMERSCFTGFRKAVKEQNLKPRAKVLATALVGTDPTIMLTGPAPAARKALEKLV